MRQGYIALHRKMLENPIVCKDTDHMAVWIYLLLNATHTNYDSMFQGSRITLKPGQLLTGRKSIAMKLKINESKVQRILKLFESEQQIEQQTSNQNRLITVVRWIDYQSNGQASEQRVNNKRTTSEQRVNTNNNVNKVKKDNKTYIEIFEHWLVQDIISHKAITGRISKAMDKALEDYSIEEIKDSISTYGEAYHSNFYFSHKYTLEKFLKQNNGIPDWIEEGSMYENYMDYLDKSDKRENNKSGWKVDAS